MSTSIRLQEKSVSTDPEELEDVSVIYYCETICSIEIFNETLLFFFFYINVKYRNLVYYFSIDSILF